MMYPKWITFIAMIILFSSCAIPHQPLVSTPVQPTKNQEIAPLKQVISKVTPIPSVHSIQEPEVTRVTIGAVGDILLHNRVYEDALKPDGTYDFNKMFLKVKEFMHHPEIVVANQESITGGKELGLASYPHFNSPHEIGDALKSAGVNLITMANNHALDMKEPGILSAIAYWDKIGMAYTGAFKSQEDRDRIRTITKNKITFAFLAYTYGTNGIEVPNGKSYLVNLSQEDLMKKDIELAKSKGDVVVVSMHWGIEYQTVPNVEQTRVAKLLAEWGADIIIGTHPHVLQPFAWIETAGGHRTFVMYSLGNFLSAQSELIQLIGGIGEITVVKTNRGDQSSIKLINPTFIATYNYSKRYHAYEIIPMKNMEAKYLEKAARQLENIQIHMRKYIPELMYP
jgi:poly-gamma-glutamate capsule biosynthesis protein CapA/YwtB (metallophosphatase superfamily)